MTAAAKTLVTTQQWNAVPTTGTHVDNAKYVATLWNDSSDRVGNINMMPSYAVFMRADANDTYTVTCGLGNLNAVAIPWNATWKSYHSDGQIIVIDTDSQSTWEFFGVDNTTGVNIGGKTITATRGDYYNADTLALTHSTSRGIGIPYIHMLILEQEILNASIPHALSMRIKTPNSLMAWYPAQKIEVGGGATLSSGVPEGARFYLNTAQVTIDAWAATLDAGGGGTTLGNFGRMVAAAMKTYGFYITDNAGNGNGIDFQHTSSMLSAPIASVSASLIRDMLDGLLTSGSFTLLGETGPRLGTPTTGPKKRRALVRPRSESVAQYFENGNIVAEWNADDHGTTLMTDDGAGLISSWSDRIGGMALTGTTTARPTWAANSFNGKYGGVTFDGVANCLVSTVLTTLLTGATGGEIWAVLDNTQAPGTATIPFGYGGTATDSRSLRKNTATPARFSVTDGASTPGGTLVDFAGRHVVCGVWEASPLMTGHIDSVQETALTTTIAALATGTTRCRIGASNAGVASAFFGGVIRRIIVKKLSTPAQRTLMFKALNLALL